MNCNIMLNILLSLVMSSERIVRPPSPQQSSRPIATTNASIANRRTQQAQESQQLLHVPSNTAADRPQGKIQGDQISLFYGVFSIYYSSQLSRKYGADCPPLVIIDGNTASLRHIVKYDAVQGGRNMMSWSTCLCSEPWKIDTDGLDVFSVSCTDTS